MVCGLEEVHLKYTSPSLSTTSFQWRSRHQACHLKEYYLSHKAITFLPLSFVNIDFGAWELDLLGLCGGEVKL